MEPAAGGNHVTSWLPLNQLWLLRLYRTVEEGPCSAAISDMGKDCLEVSVTWHRQIPFLPEKFLSAFLGKRLRESI